MTEKAKQYEEITLKLIQIKDELIKLRAYNEFLIRENAFLKQLLLKKEEK